MTDKVQLIKEEIERRILQCERLLSKDMLERERSETNVALQQYKEILQFINSLPEEPGCEVNFTTKSEDLEEEIEIYSNNIHFPICYDDYIRFARHFAEWQKQKDRETIELAEEHAMLAGMMKEREEMMKDAVDAFVNTYENNDDSNYVEFVTEQSPYKFKELEKCKIIIVKEV